MIDICIISFTITTESIVSFAIVWCTQNVRARERED